MSALQSFNVVLVGENFPVGSLDISDFTFRGRKFQEQLRIGPTVQAASRNVQIFAVPDRLQVTVTEPDDLNILAEGAREVIETFRDYIGRRSVTAVGHNMQAYFTEAGGMPAVMDELVNKPIASDLIGAELKPPAQLVLVSKVGREDQLTLTLAADDAQRGVLDLNFNYTILGGETTVDDAMAELRNSLAHAETIRNSFAARYSSKVASS